MVIYLKNFEDFKAILDRVNLVVFYKTREIGPSDPLEESDKLYSIDLYVVDGNTSYGYREPQSGTEEELKTYLMKFDEAVEINSID